MEIGLVSHQFDGADFKNHMSLELHHIPDPRDAVRGCLPLAVSAASAPVPEELSRSNTVNVSGGGGTRAGVLTLWRRPRFVPTSQRENGYQHDGKNQLPQ